MSKEREGELLNIYSLHSRGGKKKRKISSELQLPLLTPQTNFGGEVGESPGRRKAATKESIKLNLSEESEGGSG